MPVPHKIQMQIIKKRLIGKEGKAKIKEIESIMQELPGFNTGPYGEIKKWLKKETNKTKIRSKIKHQDWLGVKKQGIKQFVLVGCPNIGKSSLLKNLSGLQTQVADYEFTTLKPLPGVINLYGAEFQIVDLPGLVEGAAEGMGEGKKFLSIVRTADGIILMHDLTKPVSDVEKIHSELEKSNINKPLIIVGSKKDIPRTEKNLLDLREGFPCSKVIAVSNITEEGLQELKKELWNLSNLMRIYPKNEKNPVILEKGSSVEDFVAKIHTDLIKKFKWARVTGKSSKFPNQQVGLSHLLEDGDVLELVLEQ
jgi:small GTP-binding protein